jgi:hypothetical protein
MRSSGDSRIIAFGLNRVWEPPVVNSLPINSTANAGGPEGDSWVMTYLANPDPPQPRPPCPVDRLPAILDGLPCAPLDGRAAVTSELDQRTWVPPAMTKLLISATALGNAYNFDGQSFAYGLRPNPEPQPRPPLLAGRLPASDALHSVVRSQLDQRTWVPPAVTRLPISATANWRSYGFDGQVLSYGLRPDPEPQPRPPRPVDRLQGLSDAPHSTPPEGKAVSPWEFDQRTWVPPAMTTLPIGATANGVGAFSDGMFVKDFPPACPELEHWPRPPCPVGCTPVWDALPSAQPDNKAAVPSELDQRTWVAPAATMLPLGATAGSLGFGNDYASEQIPCRPDPEPQPRPRSIGHLQAIADASRSTPPNSKAAAASATNQQTWVPPAVTALPARATAIGNSHGEDFVHAAGYPGRAAATA